jgi:transcriptional regulator with PAS, ATPase and Fis domain
MIDSTDLSFDVQSVEDRDIPIPEFPPGTTLAQMLESVEQKIVELYLKRFKDNREKVAKELGVARSTLFKRLKDWGLTGAQEE